MNIRQQNLIATVRYASSAFVRAAAIASSYLLDLFIARQLPSTEANLFFSSVTVLLMLAGVSRLGLETSLIRHSAIAVTNGRADAIWGVLRSASYLVLISSGVVIALYMLARTHWDLDRLVDWRFVALLPALCLTGLIAGALQGIDKVAAALSIQHLLTPLMALILLISLMGSDMGSAFGAYAAAAACTVLFGSLLLPRKNGDKSVSAPSQQNTGVAKTIRDALPHWLANTGAQLAMWGPYLLYSHLNPTGSAAALFAATKTAFLVSLVLTLVNTVFAQQAAALHQTASTDALRRTLGQAMSVIYLIGLPICFVVIAFAEPLLSLWGEGYTIGASSLVLIGLGQLVNMLTGPVGTLLAMTGHARDQAIATLLACLCAVITSALLIPALDMLGAAVGVVTGICVQNGLCALRVYIRLGLLPIPTLFSSSNGGRDLPPLSDT